MEQTIRLVDKVAGDTVQIEQMMTSRCNEDWGVVGQRSRQLTYLNGALQSDSGSTESWFVRGKIWGVELPQAPPVEPPPPPTYDYYIFSVQNLTEGHLEDVWVGSVYIGDMAPGEWHIEQYDQKPVSILVTAQSGESLGKTLYWDILHTPGDETTGRVDLALDASYYSLWVVNNTGGYVFDKVILDKGYIPQQYYINHLPRAGVRVWYGFFREYTFNNVYIYSGAKYWYVDPITWQRYENDYGSSNMIWVVY